jgi:phospholipase/carboxylesterase
MSYSVGLTNPDKIKGILTMSGRILENIKPYIKVTEKLKELKIFITHGTKDNVLVIEYARESYAYLKQLGLNPTYTEYDEGHTISNAMFTDMIKWLK